MSGALLEMRGVEVTYRRAGQSFVALRDVDFALRRGERVGVVGGSGSGKTTLARTLLGLVRPSAGEVRFRDERVDHVPEKHLAALRHAVTLVFQDPNSSLNPRMRLGDIIAEPLRSPRISDRPRTREARRAVADVLESVGLEADVVDRFPHQLSGGQRQRIAIARALVSNPEAIIADEPVSALDVSVRAQVLNLLADAVATRGIGLLFVSHDLGVVRHLCDRVVVMAEGRVVEEGPVAAVFEQPQHPYTRELLAASLSL